MTEGVVLTLIWLAICLLCIFATLFFKGEGTGGDDETP